MKILVTGARGFVGRNLCLALKNGGHDVLSYDLNNTKEELDVFKGSRVYFSSSRSK